LFKIYFVLFFDNIFNIIKLLHLIKYIAKKFYYICKLKNALYKFEYKFKNNKIKYNIQYYYLF